MRLNDAVLGLLFMAGAAAFFAYTFTFPAFPGQPHGAALFPRVVGVGVFVCGALLFDQGRRSGQPWLTLDPAWRESRRWLSFLAIPGAILFYLLTADRMGFLPTAAIMVGALGWWMGLRPMAAVVLGMVSAGVVQWFFGTVMRIPLPRGWFMQMWAGG